MNVLLISPEFPLETNWGGIATYNYNLALLLAELGHDVKVLTTCQKSKWLQNTIEVIPVTKKSNNVFTSLIKNIFKKYAPTTAQILSWNYYSFLKVQELEKQWKPNLVFTSDFFSPTLLLQCMKPSLPIIQVLHGPQIVFGEYQQSTVDLKLQILLEKIALFSNAYPKVCGSKSLKKRLLKKGVKNITYIPHFLKQGSHKTFAPDFQKNNLIFFGRVEPRKGVDLLIAAFAKIALKNKKVRLFIIGRQMPNFGPLRNQYVTESKIVSTLPSSIKDRIFFIPQTDNKEELFELLDSLNGIVVLPALYEPVGFSSIEALLRNHLVVTTKNSEPLLAHGISGFYCEPTVDSIVKHITHIQKVKPNTINAIKNKSSIVVRDYASFAKAKIRYSTFIEGL